MTWLFNPPAPVALSIIGRQALFPVRRILCVGQNYAAHAREMGADPTREAPFFFAKPCDALTTEAEVPFPSATENLHHEVELVCAIGGEGADLSPAAAGNLIIGWAVGVDLTRRDIQAEAKSRGRPWDASKGFDHSAPCGPLTLGALPNPGGAIALAVNGEMRQSARLDQMIWSPAEVVAQASRLWRLMPGDLIFTGTPEGVGPVVRGDRIEAAIAGLAPLTFTLT
ncbi:MAG: fumarylacetoacetate hydrolase family protein [Brevundimonas sp.]|uniref:fumarylacetoacetate hydrolase family protein n=1 Tax=Brevundimonas sp. TaxID=1871086 RepID=UPI00391B4395